MHGTTTADILLHPFIMINNN